MEDLEETIVKIPELAAAIAWLERAKPEERLAFLSVLGNSFCALCGCDFPADGRYYCAPGYDE